MRFSVLASGSSGNATFVEARRDPEREARYGGILIDAGLSRRRLTQLLAVAGRSFSDVRAILLTHGHSDHTSGLRSCRKNSDIRLFSGPGVGEKFGAEIMEANLPFEVCGIGVRFFEVPHDAPTYGIRLEDDAGCLAVATDFGAVSQGILDAVSGADAVVLEANHDYEWLMRGPYPAHLKRRIASDDGHLSNDQTAHAAVYLAKHGLKDAVLGHLSRTNNSPARATGVVGHALRNAGHRGVRVRAAIAGRPTPWVDVGREIELSQAIPDPERSRTGTESLFGGEQV